MPVECSMIGRGTIIHHPELVNIYGARIGENCSIGCFVEIGPADIGDYCRIGSMAFIPEGVYICNRVFIGPGVIFTNDKYPPSGRLWKGQPPTEIRDGASIGAGAIILPGVIIGASARVAAGAIVTKDVKDGALWISNGESRKSSSMASSSMDRRSQNWRRPWRAMSGCGTRSDATREQMP